MAKNYNYFLGAPARYASPAGLSATTPQSVTMGLMVADSSFLRSLCRSLCPKAPAFAVFSLQSWRKVNVEFLMLTAGNRQVRGTLPTEMYSPSSPRKGWIPATKIDFKLVIYKLLPDDGVGDIKVCKSGDVKIFCLSS